MNTKTTVCPHCRKVVSIDSHSNRHVDFRKARPDEIKDYRLKDLEAKISHAQSHLEAYKREQVKLATTSKLDARELDAAIPPLIPLPEAASADLASEFERFFKS